MTNGFRDTSFLQPASDGLHSAAEHENEEWIAMFVVVFEVHPGPGRKDDYLGLAKYLKPILESIDGFIDNERFESRRRPGWVLSLSTWHDEKSLVRWRSKGEHHKVQERGRSEVFSDYRIRVCEVTADTTEAGLSGQRFDETESGEAKALAVTEASPASGGTPGVDAGPPSGDAGIQVKADGLTDHDVFDSIYNPGKILLLTSWRTDDAASAWRPTLPAEFDIMRHRVTRVIRDYGMFDRREAPQYYPPVTGAQSMS
jgi:heme-degrading monooxygenase HmoA